MIQYPTFLERYRYLSLGGTVGASTFGFDRYVNQMFYQSREWQQIRRAVITRDFGCDLAIEGNEIRDKIYIHHMNPITLMELEHGDENLLDPESLICVSHTTHNAIHYGDEGLLPRPFAPRKPGDTKLWERTRV